MKMQEMYDSLKADPYDPVATSTAGRKFVLLWTELGNEARGLAAARGRPQVLYRFYPKHHLLVHAQSGNPALNWCYGDESAIGDAIKVAESGHAATLHRLVMVKQRV